MALVVGGQYDALVAPAMFVQGPAAAGALCHWYVNVPLPPAGSIVMARGVGREPAQTVCESSMAGAVSVG